MKVNEAWWNKFIDLAQQREDALGAPAPDSPTAEQLRRLLEMSLQYFSQESAPWWLMKRLPFDMAYVVSLWTRPEKDPIGVHMFPELQQYISWHIANLAGGNSDFLDKYRPGEVILKETSISLSIVSVVETLDRKLMEVQAQIEAQPDPEPSNVELLNSLLKRWLFLYLAFSDARTGGTYQKALDRAKLPPKKRWFRRG